MFTANFMFAQNQVDSLIKSGIEFYDNGLYANAVSDYKKAIDLEPNNLTAHYELSLTFMATKDYQLAINHADFVIERDSVNSVDAYVVKGSSLDYLGKTEESNRIFEEAIRRFGDNHYIYFNLGINYYNKQNASKAQEAFENAIRTNPNHASSHYMLGVLMSDQKKRVQSLLSFYYFLFLEPKTGRSVKASTMLNTQFYGNIKQDKPNNFTINISSLTSADEFGFADLMLSMFAASNNLEKNKSKTKEELFIENTKSFFGVLGDKTKGEQTGIWWKFYIPFYNKLAKSDHLDTFCYYITQSTNDKSVDWLILNEEKIEQFSKWLEEE